MSLPSLGLLDLVYLICFHLVLDLGTPHVIMERQY